jgi:phage-related protein
MRISQEQNRMEISELMQLETKRLSCKYNKDFLDCEDLMKITNLGRDNVSTMMKRKDFPLLKVGKRNIVNIASFVEWQIRQTYKEV